MIYDSAASDDDDDSADDAFCTTYQLRGAIESLEDESNAAALAEAMIGELAKIIAKKADFKINGTKGQKEPAVMTLNVHIMTEEQYERLDCFLEKAGVLISLAEAAQAISSMPSPEETKH